MAGGLRAACRAALQLLGTAVCLLCLGLTLGAVALKGPGRALAGSQPGQDLGARFGMYMTNRRSDALDGVLEVEKVYWLHDSDTVAPLPDPQKAGSTADPARLADLLRQGQGLLRGENTAFSPEVALMPGSQVEYYLDETILCITWKQIIGTAVYTFSEVKIAHPSQLRRFLADGRYGSQRQYYTTDMAAGVHAVTASNGDFYKYRSFGIVVEGGQVYRAGSHYDNLLDSCFIDSQGTLRLVRAGELPTWEAVERYVAETGSRFSLSFGPVLVEEGRNAVPREYILGEVNGNFSRSAICQLGELHYLLAVTSYEAGCDLMPRLTEFADVLVGMGALTAYNMDGGQTAAIVTNGKLINVPNYGTQRTVSDIIYFATAVPDGG